MMNEMLSWRMSHGVKKMPPSVTEALLSSENKDETMHHLPR